MKATEAIAQTLATSDMVLRKYVSDLSDIELLSRPGVGCNHLAWQLGHLIVANCSLLNAICPGKAITLPDGFEAEHSKEQAGIDDPTQFRSKDEYLSLLDQTQQATRLALATMTPEELDQPSPEHLRSYFPTVGNVMILLSTHAMMHAGQFVPVRRALGKPVVI